MSGFEEDFTEDDLNEIDEIMKRPNENAPVPNYVGMRKNANERNPNPKSIVKRNGNTTQKNRRVKFSEMPAWVSKNEYRANQTTRNYHRNPQLTMLRNNGNKVLVSTVPPSNIFPANSQNHYNTRKMKRGNQFATNLLNFHKRTLHGKRSNANRILPSSMIKLLQKYPNKTIPNILQNRTIRNRNKWKAEDYLNSSQRSTYIASKLYAQSLHEKHPEEAIEMLKDKLQNVRSQIKRTNNAQTYRDLEMKKELIQHVMDKIIRDYGLRFQTHVY